MACDDWARWIPVLEKMLADLETLNAYLRGEMSHEEYCEQVGVGNYERRVTRLEAA
jgi:hypothetical protein